MLFRNLSTTLTRLVIGLVMLNSATPAMAEAVAVRFYSGMTDLQPFATEALMKVATEAKARPDTVVTINRRGDGLRAGMQDLLIEEARALRALQFLAEQGIDPARIMINAPAGDAQPAFKHLNVSVEVSKKTVKPTITIEPGSGTPATAEKEFRFFFNRSASDFIPVNETALQTFLKSVGQPGHDSIEIEGYTDTRGDERYNQILSELRALKIYEMLVRQGLPAARINPVGKGVAQEERPEPGLKERQDARRRAVVRWTTKTPAAEQPAPEVAQAPETPVAEPEKKRAPLFDLVPFIGMISPMSDLKDDAKSGTIYGLGIGKDFWTGEGSKARATFALSGKSKLAAKRSDRSGDLNISMMTLRADYVFGLGAFRPYAGLGIGNYQWSGTISRPSTGQQNTGKKSDLGAIATLGLDWVLLENFLMGPEASFHQVSGDFNESLLTLLLSARWGI